MDLQILCIPVNSIQVLKTFIIFTTFVARDLSANTEYEACMPENCGKGPDISYPFWILNRQSPYCGHPNYMTVCNNSYPLINITSNDYLVKDIFYANNSFRLVNNAFVGGDNACPLPMYNVSFDGTPFHRDDDSVFSFFYNCSVNPANLSLYPINCVSNDTHYSFAVMHKEVLERKNYSLESCQKSVDSPLDIDGGINMEKLVRMNYQEVLKMGIVLQWSDDNCSKCNSSGGHCGFENNEFVCFCHNGPQSISCPETKSTLKTIAIVSSSTAFGLFVTVMVITYFRSRIKMRFWEKESSNQQKIEAFIKSFGLLAPRRFSYSDIKKMTNSFQDKLGQGGYGGVYKGKLLDGRLVAVKLLSSSKGNGEDFLNEVASISKTSHVNVVALLGFCFQHNRRALVYEFMPNGSLDKLISDVQQLGLEKLSEIAIGIARGLEYLHCGCSTRILHLDIKPHNILLDEDFTPKIADFGLAKLFRGKESKISMSEARGTVGYIAPEVFCRNFGNVSHKSDVYSYGMMILEMVGGRNKCDIEVSDCSEMYFPQYLYNQLKQDENLGMMQGILTREQIEITRKMIIVGLWCIQTDPSQRPSINKVLKMLEGSIETLQVPPRHFVSSPPRPSRIPAEATSLVESSQ